MKAEDPRLRLMEEISSGCLKGDDERRGSIVIVGFIKLVGIGRSVELDLLALRKVEMET